MHIQQIFENFRRFSRVLSEGGGKAPDLTDETALTPINTQQAVSEYNNFINQWSAWLNRKHTEPTEEYTTEQFVAEAGNINMPGVRLVGPVGSTAHIQRDIDSQGVQYGDLDILVELPIPSWVQIEDPTQLRLVKLAMQRRYKQQLVDYIEETRPVNIHADATLGRNQYEGGRDTPFMIILKLAGGGYVQADTIITYSDMSEWTKARYTPQHGYKGYTHGNFYDVLSELLSISLSKDGIIAKFRSGKLVSPRMRRDVSVKAISNNPLTFFVDIAKFFGVEKPLEHPLLKASPGIDPETHATTLLTQLASGTKALFVALESAGIFDDSQAQMQRVFLAYKEKNDKEAARREDKVPESQGKYIKMSNNATQIVANVFGITN